MADESNQGGLFGLVGPGLRYAKGRLRVLLGTDENSAAPGNKLPGTYPINTTGATDGQGLVFDAETGQYVPGDGGDAVNLASTAPTTITPGDSAAVGSATTAARANHRHAAPAFGTTAGTILEGSADAGMLHKAGAETITGTKRLDAQLRITPDTYPPTVGLFGCDADGSDPRSLINYSVYGGASQYRSLGFGVGAQPATVDAIAFQAVDSDTDDYASASFSGQRLAFSFGNFTDPVLSLGEYTVYYEYNTLLWRNHYTDAAGIAVSIAGYSAGDTATDKVGGGLDIKPGEGAGNSAGAVLRLYAGATSTTPGTARNGWVLGLTVSDAAVTAAVPVVASAGLTAQGTVKLALGSDAAGDLHYTSNSDGTQARLAAGTGWLHNNGSGTFAYSTPSYSDVGADASGAAASALATAGAYTIGAGAGLTGGGAISGSPTLDVGAGTGITVAANSVAVDQTFAPTWSGLHIFTASTTAIQLGPTAGDGTARVIRGSNGSSAVGTGLSFVTGNGSAGLAGGAFVFTAGGPVSGNVSGSGYSFTASNASGTSTNAGGGFAVTTGNGSGEAGGFGNGGAFSVTTGTGYNGGAITLTVGDSRYAGGVGGTGGAFTATAGRGGFSPGGAMTLLSGPGGAADASSSGTTSGAASLKSNTGGAGSATRAAGASGTVTVQSGDAGANAGGGGAASGNVVVDTGAATGAATNGTLSLGTTNANAVTIGRSGKTTTVAGALAVTGAATLNGAVTLGDATGDDITITGRVAATIDAKTNNAVDVGSSSRAFRTLYAATSVLTALVDTISGTLSIGTSTATAVSVSVPGKTTTVNGALAVTEAFTANSNVTLGDATADTISILGIPVLPKVTTTARDALTPAEAMLVYNTTTKRLNFYDTTTWREVTST